MPRFKSIALWPESVCLGRIPNESTDTHATRAAAEHVCRMLEREGLGGERKIFPISTRFEEVPEEPSHWDLGLGNHRGTGGF